MGGLSRLQAHAHNNVVQELRSEMKRLADGYSCDDVRLYHLLDLAADCLERGVKQSRWADDVKDWVNLIPPMETK